MQLWERLTELTVQLFLRLGETCKIKVRNADGTETDISMAELKALAVSERVVTLTDTSLSVTQAAHDGKTIVMAEPGGNAAVTITLPAATGSGTRLRFVVGVVNASNYVIQVADATDVMAGNIIANSAGDTPDLAQPWPTAADSDTITLNGTTTGGAAIGDFVELEDIAANTWAVRGVTTASGTEATPFSAAVS